MEEAGMKRLTLFTTACVLAVVAVFATQLRAQSFDTNDRTVFMFKTAVELPGVTLEPGEYEFRLADTPQRNVVQVLRREDMKPMGQFTFAPSERERATDETMVLFKEAREGMTPAVQYWYFPNEKVGKEFIYPKDQAAKIATRTGQTVRSDEGPVTAANAEANPAPPAIPPAPSDSPRPVAAQADASPVSAQPATEEPASGNRGIVDTQPSASARADTIPRAPTTPQQAQATPPEAQAAPQQTEPRPVGTSGIAQEPQQAGQVARSETLPDTASPVPLSALIGLLSLVGAAGLRALRS
jgi:hypothetical protein